MGKDNHKQRTFSRRDLLKGGLLAGALLALRKCLPGGSIEEPSSIAQGVTPTPTDRPTLLSQDVTPTPINQSSLLAPADTPTPQAYLPYVSRQTGASIPGQVVHVHDPDATNWSGSGWYGDGDDAVNQGVVDSMVQAGLQQVTGKSSWADIWSDLFSQVQSSGYQVGQKIAIKVNFNNSGYLNGGCQGTGNYIDALPQPVKALVAGLVGAGVEQNDIWIYDATGQHANGRIIPDRFRNPILASYPSVEFYGLTDCIGVNPVTFGGHSSLTVQFSDPHSNLSDRLLTDILYQATYLINMPILKVHGISPASLGFKNHFGSINNIERAGNDRLHIYINPSESLYSSAYSPMVDIFLNPNIKDKTILTVGDGLYGAFGATLVPPTSWSTFGDAPNSLLFSSDPVAIDCVMTDLLAAEGRVGDDAYHYLFVAQDAELGVCEGTRDNPGGDPWQTPYGSGYTRIQYIRVES